MPKTPSGEEAEKASYNHTSKVQPQGILLSLYMQTKRDLTSQLVLLEVTPKNPSAIDGSGVVQGYVDSLKYTPQSGASASTSATSAPPDSAGQGCARTHTSPHMRSSQWGHLSWTRRVEGAQS